MYTFLDTDTEECRGKNDLLSVTCSWILPSKKENEKKNRTDETNVA